MVFGAMHEFICARVLGGCAAVLEIRVCVEHIRYLFILAETKTMGREKEIENETNVMCTYGAH